MLKKEVSYKDFDGNKVTDVLHFHLSEAQIMRLDAEYPQGLEAGIKEMVANDDRAAIFQMFEKFILMAYGRKSEDGRRFIRTDEMTEEFTQSLAYEELLSELATSETAAVDFFNGVTARALSKHMAAEVVAKGSAGQKSKVTKQ